MQKSIYVYMNHKSICGETCMIMYFVHVYMCMHVFRHTYIHIYMNLCMDVGRHECMYVCAHIYMHTCTQNVIPGNVSFNQKYINDHRYERTKWLPNENIFDSLTT